MKDKKKRQDNVRDGRMGVDEEKPGRKRRVKNCLIMPAAVYKHVHNFLILRGARAGK